MKLLSTSSLGPSHLYICCVCSTSLRTRFHDDSSVPFQMASKPSGESPYMYSLSEVAFNEWMKIYIWCIKNFHTKIACSQRQIHTVHINYYAQTTRTFAQMHIPQNPPPDKWEWRNIIVHYQTWWHSWLFIRLKRDIATVKEVWKYI